MSAGASRCRPARGLLSASIWAIARSNIRGRRLGTAAPRTHSSATTSGCRQEGAYGSSAMSEVDLYNTHYGHLAADVQTEIRRDTYDDDLGQSSWITLAEAREWFRQLRLDAGSRVLEVACGSGGITRRLAAETGASAVGVDINPHGIDAATASAAREGLSSRVSFQLIDAGKRLPFADASFDAIFCNDAINHLPGREEVFTDWH